MSLKYVQSNTLYLAGSGVTVGATSITLTTLTDIYANVLTMTDFGSKGYITLEPDTTNEEAATFTGVTANANGTYTLTGVSTVLAKSPYTETSGLVRAHSGGTKVVITDNVGFWNTFANKTNNETITGVWGTANAPTANNDFANKAYVDGIAIAGAPNASTTVKGIGTVSVAPVSATAPIFVGDNDTRVPTAGQAAALPGNNASIAVGSGNKYVTQTGFQRGQEIYAATATGNDSYAVTLSPAPTAYVTGMVVNFKTDVANTGTASLNVNGLGAITIKKNGSATLADNDIAAGQVVTVIYDGTNFQMQSQTATSRLVDVQLFTTPGANTWTALSGAKFVFVELWGGGGGSGGCASGSVIASAGGGGGGYISRWMTATTAGSSQTVTVGAGGTAGASGANAGGNGGNTTFGSLLTAYGGSGTAAGNTTTTGGNGGGVGVSWAGGTGSAGGSNVTAVDYGGGGGSGGINTGGNNTAGGNSIYGGGGGSGGNVGGTTGAGGTSSYEGGTGGVGGVNTVGTAGSAPGGGAGGSGTNNAGARAGAAGGAGQARITTFF